MKQQVYLYRRRGTYYLQDARTGKQQSLETKDRKTAARLLEIKRQTVADPGFNHYPLKTCLSTQDPQLSKRTWRTVMDQMQTHGRESSRDRCARAVQSAAFDRLRELKLIETSAGDFLTILTGGKVSVQHYLKRLHNLALGLGWLAFPVLAPRLWPKTQFKPKRAITAKEHQQILAAEKNLERNLQFYKKRFEADSHRPMMVSSAGSIVHRTNEECPIRALQERIELLEVQKKSIGNQLKELKAVTTIYRRASLNKVLVSIKADLNIARERLASYKAQTRQQNSAGTP
jgi:hypothetical protein